MNESSPDARTDVAPALISTLPPGPRHRRAAAWFLALMVAAAAVTAPFADIPLAGSGAFLPAYAAAMLTNEAITAALLLAVYATERSLSVLALSLAYLFSGLLIVPWALTFPGVFAPGGFLDAGLQTTASIAALRRIGFPLLVLAYALLRREEPRAGRGLPPLSVRATILAGITGVAALCGGSTWLILAGEPHLPNWMASAGRPAALWSYVPAAAGLLCLGTLLLLWQSRRRSVLDLWLIVVLCASLIEILLLAVLSSQRFSVGWWAGRFYGFTAGSVVLVALLAETTALYASLVRSTIAERRVREARLTTMEALSASIAHEVNQPLASMVTNASAGLRWLARQPPDLSEAEAAFGRIVEDGHRAGDVVTSVRSMFRDGSAEREPVDVNRAVLEVLARCRSEARIEQVTIETRLAPDLPVVSGDRVQLEQVFSNLVANALQAMRPVIGRARTLHVASAREGADEVLVSVSDSGIGVNPQTKERIFEPFFSTKSGGMGMGLVFCRLVVEAHGGRLAMIEGEPGMIVRVFLPADTGR